MKVRGSAQNRKTLLLGIDKKETKMKKAVKSAEN